MGHICREIPTVFKGSTINHTAAGSVKLLPQWIVDRNSYSPGFFAQKIVSINGQLQIFEIREFSYMPQDNKAVAFPTICLEGKHSPIKLAL